MNLQTSKHYCSLHIYSHDCSVIIISVIPAIWSSESPAESMSSPVFVNLEFCEFRQDKLRIAFSAGMKRKKRPEISALLVRNYCSPLCLHSHRQDQEDRRGQDSSHQLTEQCHWKGWKDSGAKKAPASGY